MHAEVSLTKANIPLIFGQDAAELEDPDRLKAFFIINEAYDDLRIAHPISLVIGQRGIGKTALLAMSAQADSDEKIPNVSLKGSEILRLSEADARAAIAVEAFKEFVENAILETLVSSLSEGAAELIPIPPKAQNFLSRIAALAAIVVANENAIIKNNAKRAAPWIYESIKTFTVYIDDTDIEWNGSEASARTISNMIQACYNIASESKAKVRFKISIRSDIFNFLRTHADYLDKIQGGIVRLRWSNDDVFRVIAKRIAIFTNKPYDDSNNLSQRQIFQEFYSKIFEEYYKGQGAWENAQTRKVIMSFVRQRPRDLIAFCTLAAQRAVGTGEKINTDQISNIIPNYCRNRLDDTVKEFKSELPEIEFLLREMRPKANAGKGVPRYLFTHDEMVARIKDIAQRKTLKFAYERMPANPAKIIDFLFRINFLVATRNTENGVDRRYYDFADDARSEIEMGRWGWEVHMAYRWAIKKSEDDFWAQVTGI